MNFWRALISAEDDVSSKRFAGLLLIGTYIGITILAAIVGNLPVEVESLAKTGLYVGASLLGVSIAGDVIKTAVRPKPVVIEKEKEDEDK